MNNCGDCGSCNLCGPFNFDKKKGNAALVNSIISILLNIISVIFLFINTKVSVMCILISIFLSVLGIVLAKLERKYYPRKINRYAIYLNFISILLNVIICVVLFII